MSLVGSFVFGLKHNTKRKGWFMWWVFTWADAGFGVRFKHQTLGGAKTEIGLKFISTVEVDRVLDQRISVRFGWSRDLGVEPYVSFQTQWWMQIKEIPLFWSRFCTDRRGINEWSRRPCIGRVDRGGRWCGWLYGWEVWCCVWWFIGCGLLQNLVSHVIVQLGFVSEGHGVLTEVEHGIVIMVVRCETSVVSWVLFFNSHLFPACSVENCN